jgi:hypothetical protein
MDKFVNNNPLPVVNLDVTLQKIRAATTGANYKGDAAVTAPLHNLTGSLYVYPSSTGKKADGVTAIDAAFVLQCGRKYDSTDKIMTVLFDGEMDLYGVVSGTFAIAPTEWN